MRKFAQRSASPGQERSLLLNEVRAGNVVFTLCEFFPVYLN